MENIDISKHNLIIIKKDYISVSDIKKISNTNVCVEKRTISFYRKYIVDTVEVSIEKSFGFSDVPGHQRFETDDIYNVDELGVFGFQKDDYQTGQDVYTKSTTKENVIVMIKGSRHNVWIISKDTKPSISHVPILPSAPVVNDNVPAFTIDTGKIQIDDASGEQTLSIDAMNGDWDYVLQNNRHKVLHRGFVNHGYDSFVGFLNIADGAIIISDTQRLDIPVSNGRYQINTYLSDGVCIGLSIIPVVKHKKSIKDKIRKIFN